VCGTFGVYEDRSAQSGRIISLRFVVLKAKRPTRRAIAMIAGGPGESAVGFAPLIADGVFEKELRSLRDTYDVLFVDNRGMGASNPSKCNFTPAADPASYFRQLWPDGSVAACRQRLAASTDLNAYNTNNAVDDLDEVRGALGYPKLVLLGGSYGTFFSLIYIRRHAEHVESAVLDGVAPPHFQPMPGEPQGAQTAMDGLIAKCRRDNVCSAHFPAFAQHFDALVRRLNRGPISVEAKNLATKQMHTVSLSKEVFVDQLRHVLYDPEGASYVPYVIERAYEMDYAPLARLIQLSSVGFSMDLDEGAYLSYSCAEFMPFLSGEEVKTAAAHSFTGDLRIRAQRRACSIWNVQAMPPSFNDPVRSELPVLIVSGSDDPATPARYGAAALRYLPNARQVIVQGAEHVTETACTDRLMVQFVRARSAKGLNVSQCKAAFTPPRFATSLAGLPQL